MTEPRGAAPFGVKIGIRDRAITALASFFTSVFTVLWLLQDNFRAKFGPIDDHETLAWLQGRNRLPITEFFSTLGTTEIGNFGESSRYRPIYYSYRVLTTVVLGDNSNSWYFFVLILFIATTTIFAFAISMWFITAARIQSSAFRLFAVVLVPVLASLLLIGLPAWKGIVTRLGPSELLGIFGVTVALAAMHPLMTSSRLRWWIPLLTGVFIAIGSKESFLPVALLPVILAIYLWSRDRRKANLVGFFSIAGALVIAVEIFMASSQGDAGFYGQQGETSRLGSTVFNLFLVLPHYWIPAVVSLSIAIGAWLFLLHQRPAYSGFLVLSLGLLLVIWLFTDGLAYSGIYDLPRYWINFHFIKLLSILGSVVLLIATIRRTTGQRRNIGLILLFIPGFLVLSQIATLPNTFASIREYSVLNADATVTYQNGLAKVAEKLENPSSTQVLIIAKNSLEWEPIVAISQHVQDLIPGSHSVAFLLDVDTSEPQGGVDAVLSGISQVGSDNIGIVPLDSLNPDAATICVFINVDPYEVLNCDPMLSFRVNARSM